VIADARSMFFRPNGVLAKADRLRVQAEQLWAKAARLQTLIDGRTEHGQRPDPLTMAKLQMLQAEHSQVSRKRRQMNEQIAKAAAHFMVAHAQASKASVIYLEDLRDMEARGKGRTLNTRLSSSVRGQIVAHTRHRAAKFGIAVVIVPARGTSKYCPKCLAAFRHRAAPDRSQPGWKWATCPSPHCGYSADRDVAAWQRIGARGLLHQHSTVLDHSSGTYVIRHVVKELDQPIQHTPQHGPTFVSDPSAAHGSMDRTKAGPTRRRPVPRQRRRVPVPPGTSASAVDSSGKRPAGRQPQSPHHPSQRWRGRQAPHTMSTPTRQRHQPTGARLGAGFHLHAHASPVTKRQERQQHQPKPLFHRDRAQLLARSGKPKLI
jgi:IS605 OrfB family transposase